MGIYAFTYAVAISLSLFCGGLVYRKYRNLFGWYFFLFTFFVSSWFFLYFLFFSGIEDPSTLLSLSRVSFGIGIGATWSLWFFVRYFDTRPSKVLVPQAVYPLVAFVPVLLAYSLTGGIVGSLEFSSADGVYREVPGYAFIIHPILHLTAVIGLFVDSYRQLRKQTHLDLLRLKRLLGAAATFIAACLILQLVLPILGIWVFEKGIVFLYFAFTAYAFFTLKRFYFDSGGFVGKYGIIGVSSLVAVLAAEAYERGRSTGVSKISDYWSTTDGHSVLSVLVGVAAYAATSHFLRSRFFGNPKLLALQSEMVSLERSVTGITNLFDLNALLKERGTRMFRTDLCEVRPLSKGEAFVSALVGFFEAFPNEPAFVNDMVFLTGRLKRTDVGPLENELPKNAFLAFPLRSSEVGNPISGFLFLGKKTLSDSYSSEEFAVLGEFATFLELHMRHMATYAELQDLSLNLDKKVDEKTIEYNNLINQQKEFISVISHEIKAPITNAVFQSDSMVDDLDSGGMRPEELKKELSVLNSQLVRAGELFTKLFSVQYYDTRSVSLFKEGVQIDRLLLTELDIYSRMHPETAFADRIDRNVGFVEIDRLQFQQVLSNLLQNAVRHAQSSEPIIAVSAARANGKLVISIEDNGKGFAGEDTEKIFDRYTTGSGGSAGLGMGLYLCRRIVEMHGGKIVAGASEEFGGARFTFEIPAP